jgi:hypothetical protein
MNIENYWTGLADFTTNEMPPNAIGIIARVTTYALGYEEFIRKVSEINSKMGGKLIVIEDACEVSDFLIHDLHEDHEIYEMLETAQKFPNDVVYGNFNYYTKDDA